MRAPASGGVAQRLQRAWLSRNALSAALLPLAGVFWAVASIRRFVYSRGWMQPQAVGAPVVVVGNLIAGGAGKTPTVMAIVAALRRHGFTPGIVSRGHGSRATAPRIVERGMPAALIGDEPLLMHLRTDAPVAIGRDRVAAARLLLGRHPEVDVVVSDDGLQHLALARTAQVLVFDERGAGNGWLLPAGPLRERLPHALPARTLVVYNAAAPSTALPGPLARRSLAGAVPLAGWWRGEPASLATLEALRGSPLVAAAGVARPGRFFAMLRSQGLDITELPLPDHHDFATRPWPPDTADVIVTEKDAIKLEAASAGATRIWVAPLNFELDAATIAALVDLLPPPGPRHGNTLAEPARLSDLQGPA